MEDNPADVALFEIGLQESYPKCNLNVIHSTEDLIGILDQNTKGTLQSTQIVILDLFTPTNDGLEILRQLRSFERFHQIPILILTNSHEANVYTHGLSIGRKCLFAQAK